MSIGLENSVANPVNWTSSISYQSKATARPTAADLRELTWKAKTRNQTLGVTGMLLYDNGRFFQTLEGPPASLQTLWSSISDDRRHSDIEILSEHIIPTRLFGEWDMLSYHGDEQPYTAMLAAKARHELTAQVPDLIDLVLNGDDLGINKRIAALAEDGWDGNDVIKHLIEPTARALGDAWLSDDCTELDLTIGLSMLQLAGHAVRHTPTPAALRNNRYSILLASAPGEAHTLGISLMADLFTDAGWHVDMAFPDSNQALSNQLASQKPDALDIGLSDALPRQHSLANLRETIERSRFAAPDQLTVVSVGGRLFADAAATADNVGADHARKTVTGTTIEIAELIRQKRQEPRSR
ncbi:BLUF domain-containing protein [Erythrobacter sp. MTPC3]|uniref:BLUF domain-containing protein n=1 Tax=Erythrobacter sp. MTPC3 TaxID=3056564 RepID=UPI0036F29B30